MAPIIRSYRFNMMLSNDEERMLRALAERRGLTASDFLRQKIRELYEKEPGSLDDRRPRSGYTIGHRDPAQAPEKKVLPARLTKK